MLVTLVYIQVCSGCLGIFRDNYVYLATLTSTQLGRKKCPDFGKKDLSSVFDKMFIEMPWLPSLLPLALKNFWLFFLQNAPLFDSVLNSSVSITAQ